MSSEPFQNFFFGRAAQHKAREQIFSGAWSSLGFYDVLVLQSEHGHRITKKRTSILSQNVMHNMNCVRSVRVVKAIKCVWMHS